jgi:hypothetical protein
MRAKPHAKHVEIRDVELIERLREKAPETLDAEIDFDRVLEKISQSGIPVEHERLAFIALASRSRKARVRSPKSRTRKD